jgi:hypothetical protein
MTRRIAWSFVLGSMLVWPLSLAAAASAKPAPDAVPAKESFFAGIVLAVAPSQKLLSVEEASLAGTHRTFVVPLSVAVRKGGATIDVSRVKVGDPVAIEYTTKGQEAIARSVEVLTDPAPEAPRTSSR